MSILGKMNSFPLRLESILIFLIYQMQDAISKSGWKMHGKKLMVNCKLKKVLPYAVKRYCLILCYLFNIKNKNTRIFLFLISYSIFLFSFYHFCICVLNLVWRRTRVNTSHKIEWRKITDLSGNQALLNTRKT